MLPNVLAHRRLTNSLPNDRSLGAAANYVRLHVGKESHLLRETINSLAAKLDPEKFLRIHRSTIVNLERVKELQPRFHGDYVVILQDGTQLNSSRSYRAQLHKLVGKSS